MWLPYRFGSFLLIATLAFLVFLVGLANNRPSAGYFPAQTQSHDEWTNTVHDVVRWTINPVEFRCGTNGLCTTYQISFKLTDGTVFTTPPVYNRDDISIIKNVPKDKNGYAEYRVNSRNKRIEAIHIHSWIE